MPSLECFHQEKWLITLFNSNSYRLKTSSPVGWRIIRTKKIISKFWDSFWSGHNVVDDDDHDDDVVNGNDVNENAHDDRDNDDDDHNNDNDVDDDDGYWNFSADAEKNAVVLIHKA